MIWIFLFVFFGLNHNDNFIFPVIWAKNLEVSVNFSLLHPLSSLSVNACASNSRYMQSEKFWLLAALTMVWAVIPFCLYYLSCLLTHLPLYMFVSYNHQFISQNNYFKKASLNMALFWPLTFKAPSFVQKTAKKPWLEWVLLSPCLLDSFPTIFLGSLTLLKPYWPFWWPQYTRTPSLLPLQGLCKGCSSAPYNLPPFICIACPLTSFWLLLKNYLLKKKKKKFTFSILS